VAEIVISAGYRPAPDFDPKQPRLSTGKLCKRLLSDQCWGNATAKMLS